MNEFANMDRKTLDELVNEALGVTARTVKSPWAARYAVHVGALLIEIDRLAVEVLEARHEERCLRADLADWRGFADEFKRQRDALRAVAVRTAWLIQELLPRHQRYDLGSSYTRTFDALRDLDAIYPTWRDAPPRAADADGEPRG